MRRGHDDNMLSSSESTITNQTPDGTQVRTEKTEVRTGMRCVLQATELRRVLRNAALFPPARRWKWLDELKGIRLEVRGTNLITLSSDQYVLTHETTTVNTATPLTEGVFILRLADAKILIDLLARDRSTDVTLTVTETHHSWTWEEPSANRKAASTTTVARKLTTQITDNSASAAAEFSEHHSEAMTELGDRYQNLLDAHEPGSLEAIAFNPRRLAKFARVVPAEPAYAMELRLSGAAKAAKVQIGDRFVALIMPVRMPATKQGLPHPSRFADRQETSGHQAA